MIVFLYFHFILFHTKSNQLIYKATRRKLQNLSIADTINGHVLHLEQINNWLSEYEYITYFVRQREISN